MDLWLLRHADSLPEPQIPEPDWPLSPAGQRQARTLVPILADLGITRIITSPYRRAKETVSPFARAMDLEVHEVYALQERCLAPVWIEDFHGALGASLQDPDLALPGGESLRDCQGRMTKAIAAEQAKVTSGVLLVSTHGQAIASILQSIDPSVGFREWRALKRPDLVRIRIREAGWEWDRGYRLELGS